MFMLLQCDDEAILKIEGLDDIEISDPTAPLPLQLVQAKHHVKPAELTDSSVDLWKSIRVWAQQAADESFVMRETRLCLLTTAKAKKGSVAAMLGLHERDTKTAESKLLEIADKSRNKLLVTSFEAFKALTPALRTALVESMYVLDKSDHIDEYKNKIKRQIRSSVRIQHLEAFFERLEGWWINWVVDHLLDRKLTPLISAFELNEKAAAIAETFHTDNLPIDLEFIDPDNVFVYEAKDKRFVQQLQAIRVNEFILENAIIDYFRAFQQRTRWLNESLVLPDELVSYEKKLINEWGRYFYSICDDPSILTEDELVAHGKKMLNWVDQQTHHLRIRPRVEAQFVRRGSFHMLADKEPNPPICWHANFMEKVVSTLTSAVKSR